MNVPLTGKAFFENDFLTEVIQKSNDKTVTVVYGYVPSKRHNRPADDDELASCGFAMQGISRRLYEQLRNWQFGGFTAPDAESSARAEDMFEEWSNSFKRFIRGEVNSWSIPVWMEPQYVQILKAYGRRIVLGY